MVVTLKNLIISDLTSRNLLMNSVKVNILVDVYIKNSNLLIRLTLPSNEDFESTIYECTVECRASERFDWKK